VLLPVQREGSPLSRSGSACQYRLALSREPPRLRQGRSRRTVAPLDPIWRRR
jgi:hypothetical protein